MTDGVSQRDIQRLESELKDLDRLWRSTTDDIKNKIESEVRELKDEPIKEIKEDMKDFDRRLLSGLERLEKVERKQERWETSAGTVHWIVRGVFGILGIVAGFLGADHFKGH